MIKVQNAKEIRKKNMSGQKCQLSNFRADYSFRADGEKATSQAELKILQFEIWLGSDSLLEFTVSQRIHYLPRLSTYVQKL